MTRRISIDERELGLGDAALPALLALAHAAGVRPLCLCRPSGIPMYVARIGDRCILKRMPGAGPQHDAGCDSYEAPYELTGFGQVAGSAIRENAEDGVTVLKLDFILSKTGARSALGSSGVSEADSVRTDGSKLSLRALLHYLWDQAEFTRWRPGMSGKRNWAVIRKFLLEAAEDKTAKGKPLRDSLYIPETFNLERESEITQRRLAFVNPSAVSEGSLRPLLLLIGEVKEIAPARFGHRILVKHLPKLPFLLNEDVNRRMRLRFASELSLWDALPDTHLIAIATFALDANGIAVIEAISLMNVNENWIPFEHSYDATLLDVLTRRRAGFLKGLRYNLPIGSPLASVVLAQEGLAPVAMYIVPPHADEAFRAELEKLTGENKMIAWVWQAGKTEMPPLPK